MRLFTHVRLLEVRVAPPMLCLPQVQKQAYATGMSPFTRNRTITSHLAIMVPTEKSISTFLKYTYGDSSKSGDPNLIL